MILSYSIVLVYANVYLFKFLKTQEAKNFKTIWKNKKETDQRKIRKRNLVPAEVGLIHTILLGLTYLSKTKYLEYFDSLKGVPNMILVNVRK